MNDRIEHLLDMYLESLACMGTEDTGYYYVGDTQLIEDLLYEFGYDADDFRANALTVTYE